MLHECLGTKVYPRPVPLSQVTQVTQARIHWNVERAMSAVNSSRESVQSRQQEQNASNETASLLSHYSDPQLDPESNSEQPGAVLRVNPLNQKSARVFRVFMIILFSLAFFLLSLLSIDQLISVGVGATQGSGFEAYTVTLLGVATIGTSLLFYRAPSPSDRTLNLLAAAILIIDMLLISLVEQLRRRIGPILMLFSFGGATLACLISSASDEVVQRAKLEEQERVLGHTSARRSYGEWVEVIFSNTIRFTIFALVLLLSINLVFDASDSHVSVGSFVSIGGLPDGNNDGTLIHLACSPAGTSGPLVIIEAGETSGEDIHGWVQRAQGIKTVCFWDRPGFGLSDNAPSPLGIEAVMSYLLAALETEIPEFHEEKVVLVSHGVGSLYSRVFANKISDNLGGLMLIDALHEQQFYQDQTALHGLREFVRGLLSTLTINKLTGIVRGLGAEERLFGLLAYTQPRLHKSLLQQQVSANRRSALDIGLATGSLPADIPVLVVSSSESCQDKQWNRYQRLLLKLTDRVVAWKILDGPHNLWWNKRAEKELITQLESFVSYVKK